MGLSHEVKKIGGKTPGHFSPVHLSTPVQVQYTFTLNVFTCSFVCLYTYSAHPSQDPSGIHNLLGWFKSGQGKTRWFKSCPCRSREGAGDLFYMKAKMVEGLEWKCDPCPSGLVLLTLSCTTGTL